jgi:NADH-quinone oxidoreductase subunit H
VEAMVITIIQIILSPVLALIIGIFFLGLSRKIMARIHWRYGPPLYQPVIDIIKLFSQKGISHGFMFGLGVIISLAGSIVVILLIPFGTICPLESSGGLLVILYLMLFAPLGIALSGGEGANPNISIGISRKLILSLAYEVPFLLILLTLMTHYKTISIMELVQIQQNTGWALFSLPLLLPGLSYLLILPAIMGMRPFDVVSAPQEISSGPNAEYGGKYLGLITIEHGLHLFIGAALFVNLFLGGASNPALFFLKILLVFIVCIFINAVFPRFRTEQAVKYLWSVPTLFALAGLIINLVVT